MITAYVKAERLLSLCAAFGLIAACGGSDKNTGNLVSGIGQSDQLTVPKVDSSLCDVKGKRVENYDLNSDGRPDEWKLYATTEERGTELEVLTCKQADLDYDGKKDYVITFALTGEVIAEEFDFDFDGNFDAREHFDKKTGKRFLVERDSDFDKVPDIWEKYDEQGNKESVRRDRNGDGKPDYWEQYKNGMLIAMLYDNDYDSRVDAKEMATGVGAPPPDEAADSSVDSGADETPADSSAEDPAADANEQ